MANNPRWAELSAAANAERASHAGRQQAALARAVIKPRPRPVERTDCAQATDQQDGDMGGAAAMCGGASRRSAWR